MKVKEYVKTLVEDVKAWRRGERRVAPRGVRGRVYAPKEEAASGGSVVRIRKEPIASLVMKVTRADGSTETIEVPAQVSYNG
jgi:hypothetical protein